jgi:hypothetical protein
MAWVVTSILEGAETGKIKIELIVPRGCSSQFDYII